jgi:hypothetical protein
LFSIFIVCRKDKLRQAVPGPFYTTLTLHLIQH